MNCPKCNSKKISMGDNVWLCPNCGHEDTIAFAHDPVNHPRHYTAGGIETIDYLRAKLSREEFIGYCRGNVLKYLSRAPHKGGKQDMEKAAVYLQWAIEVMGK